MSAEVKLCRSHVTLQVVKDGLSSASGHGISRIVSSKFTHLRVIWLLAFIACSAVFANYFFDFANKLRNPGISTSIHASHTDFEYPDIYICFDNPLSGSRFLAVNQSVVNSVISLFDQVESSLARICNSTLKPYLCTAPSSFILYPAKVNSLPFHLLADSLARRVDDLVLSSFIVQNTGAHINYNEFNLTEFYHPLHVRCLKISFNSEQQEILKHSGTAGEIMLTLMYDTFSTGLYKYLNGSNLQRVPSIFGHENNEWMAPHWSFDANHFLKPKRLSSAKFYFVPRGEYPCTSSGNILLSPGHYHTVKID
jgi:hypothetical protein